MKKLFKVCQIGKGNYTFMLCYVVICVICVLCQSRVSCVTSPSKIYRNYEYPDDGYPFIENYQDEVQNPIDESRFKLSDESINDHEYPHNIPVKVKIRGDLATPAPESNILLGFIPRQTYYQVRRYDDEIHLPQSAALTEAETAEEIANAPRLREVVSHTKTQEVYEEQGYEDSAYDHGGYNKEGEKHEVNIPRDDKTDYSRTITDQSTEHSEIVSVGQLNNFTTESSHFNKPQLSADSTNLKEKRIRKPKIRNVVSHQKTITKEKSLRYLNNSDNETVTDKNQAKISNASIHRRRNRTKSNFNKDSSSASSTVSSVTEGNQSHTKQREKEKEKEKVSNYVKKSVFNLKNEFLKPTTYRPPIPPRFLISLQRQKLLQTKNKDKDKEKKMKASSSYITKPVALISKDGYQFENPFDEYKVPDGVKTPFTFPFEYPYESSKLTTNSPVKSFSNVQTVHEKHKTPENIYLLHQPHNYNFPVIKQQFQKDAATKYESHTAPKSFQVPIIEHQFSRDSAVKYESRAIPKNIQSSIMPYSKQNFKTHNSYPYEIVNELSIKLQHDSSKTRSKYKKKPDSPIKAKDFPYEIVSEATAQPILKQIKYTPKYPKTKLMPIVNNYKLYKYEKYPKYMPSTTGKNKVFMFGEPDQSPWIPITPKEVYDLHGYDRRSTFPSEIKVTESDRSIEASLNAFVHKHKLPVNFANKENLPRVVSTSYTIHHEYQKPKSTTDSSFQSSQLNTQHRTFDNAENYSQKYKTLMRYVSDDSMGNVEVYTTTPMMEFIPSIDFNPYLQSTIPKPVTESSFEYNVTTTYPSHREMTTGEDDIDQESIENDDRDIETLSSNRYSVFQKVNYTLPMRETSTSVYSNLKDELDSSLLLETQKFLFRHPHLPRETSKYIRTKVADMTPVEESPILNTTTKRDIILTRYRSKINSNDTKSNITHLTKVSKRNDISDKVYVVYPQDYLSSAKYVERLTLAHYSVPKNVAHNPLPLNHQDQLRSLTNHVKNDSFLQSIARIKRSSANEQLVKISLAGRTTEIPVNLHKYPFYQSVNPDSLAKYSVIRYALNPDQIPNKQANHMTFYDSRNDVECVEPSPPQNIVPHREEGEWAFNPTPKTPRIRNLGDKILCLKKKFFGFDPLDNPFFKEDSVGFPEVFTTHHGTDSDQEFHEVAENSRDNDYELVPKNWFTRSKTTTNRRNLKNNLSSRSLSKKSNQYSTDDDAKRNRITRDLTSITFGNEKSSVRKWIDSLMRHNDGDIEPSLFNDQADNISNKSLVFIAHSMPEEPLRRHKRVVHKVYLAGGFINFNQNRNKSKMLTSNGTSPVANMTNEFNSSSQAHRKTYVDALTSLRNLRNSSLNKRVPISNGQNSVSENEINRVAETKQHRFYYKEPTWRLEKRKHNETQSMKNTNDNGLTSVSNPEMDSLLYVIHPKTGEGKWMKLLKIEQIEPHSTLYHANNIDTLSNFHSQKTVSEVPYFYQVNHAINNEHIEPESSATNDRKKFYRKDKNKTANNKCKEDEVKQDEIETQEQYSPDYDVYHISGLLKQVAPLKASEVEINNLQTTEENAEYGDDDSNSSLYDLTDDFYSSTHFPEPHERLYYYVVDDENNNN